jgi:glutamate synthase (NADPH/NADH) small chain
LGKVRGFLEYARLDARKRPPAERIRDWREIELPVVDERLVEQAARCMDCGIPFCNHGCPLGNLIPEWNDHACHGRFAEAEQSLYSTNNFPEITGRVCPAPCEAACVLGIDQDPVSIKLLERSIADRAFARTRFAPEPPRSRTGKKVAVVGSGPAGLSAAQELNRRGHSVAVFEKADRLGGLLTYGIPDFKLEKHWVRARIEQMRAEGVEFFTNVNVGEALRPEALLRDYHALCLAIGSRQPRDLAVPGRELSGIHFAMDFLTQQNRRLAGDRISDSEAILATGKRVVVIGGGDTGSDCVGTSHRQGAASVVSLEIMPRPPDRRAPSTPWPAWPLVFRTSTSHEEGGTREFAVMTERFSGEDGRVKKVHTVRVESRAGRLERIAGTEHELEAELVLLALGFVHPVAEGLLQDLAVALDRRGNVATDAELATNVPGVFAAGDCQRGQSLVVWAIADGRRAARAIDRYLSGLEIARRAGESGVGEPAGPAAKAVRY